MWRRQIIAERCPLSVRLRLFAVFYLGYASWYAVKTVYRQDHTTKGDNAKSPTLVGCKQAWGLYAELLARVYRPRPSQCVCLINASRA